MSRCGVGPFPGCLSELYCEVGLYLLLFPSSPAIKVTGIAVHKAATGVAIHPKKVFARVQIPSLAAGPAPQQPLASVLLQPQARFAPSLQARI